MKKNYSIRVEGCRNQRRIVREIIDRNFEDLVMSEIDHQHVGTSLYKDGSVRDHYYEIVNYKFNTNKKTYKKIIEELKFIGLNVYPKTKTMYSVVY